MAHTIYTLLAQLPRCTLESLMAEKVMNGTIAQSEILCLLPGRNSTVEAECAALSGNEAMRQPSVCQSSEGPCCLPWTVILDILEYLPLKQRFLCSISVSKGWQRLRDEVSLWQSLVAGSAFAGIPSWLQRGGFAKLVRWLPAPQQVTMLVLHTEKEDFVPDLCDLLSLLTGLKRLCLAGYKISNVLLNHLADLPLAGQLQDLTLDVYSRVFGATILRLLSKTSKLQGLGLSRRHMNLELLRQFADCVRARSHASPDFVELRCTGRSDSMLGPSHGGLEWNLVRELGQLFPCLQKLHAEDLCGICPPTEPLIAPMLHLQTLLVRHVLGAHFCSDLSEFLVALLLSCPALQYLAFCGSSRCGHGRGFLSGDTFSRLPASLVALDLESVCLHPSLVESCSLPHLQRLQVRDCGPHAGAAVRKLTQQCSNLKLQACTVEEAKYCMVEATLSRDGNS